MSTRGGGQTKPICGPGSCSPSRSGPARWPLLYHLVRTTKSSRDQDYNAQSPEATSWTPAEEWTVLYLYWVAGPSLTWRKGKRNREQNTPVLLFPHRVAPFTPFYRSGIALLLVIVLFLWEDWTDSCSLIFTSAGIIWMCRRGASRLSRCPCCPSRLGFCFPQQKSHTPGQTRCQMILQQHRRHQVHTLRIEKKGIPGIQAIEGGGKDRKLKNQRPNPAAPTQGALSTALYHVKNGICHLPHRSLRSWEEHVLYNSPALPTPETFISTTEKWPWAENHVLNKKNTYVLTSKIT